MENARQNLAKQMKIAPAIAQPQKPWKTAQQRMEMPAKARTFATEKLFLQATQKNAALKENVLLRKLKFAPTRIKTFATAMKLVS